MQPNGKQNKTKKKHFRRFKIPRMECITNENDWISIIGKNLKCMLCKQRNGMKRGAKKRENNDCQLDLLKSQTTSDTPNMNIEFGEKQ